MVGAEIVELLRLVDSQGGSQGLCRELRKNLEAALSHIPSEQELPHLLKDLEEAGVLLTAGRRGSGPVGAGTDRFADSWIQWAMLADSCRVERYAEAIRAKAPHHKHALDLGAGSGILSFLLLQAGLPRVSAIEESGAAAQLKKTVRRALNSCGQDLLTQKLEVHASNSANVSLSPKADLIVSELFGHDPFSEGMIGCLRDAQKRLGKEAACIPHSVTVHGSFAKIANPQLKSRLKQWHEARQPHGQKKASSPSVATALSLFRQAYGKSQDWDTLSFPFSLRAGEFSLVGESKALFRAALSPVPPPRKLRSSPPTRLKPPSDMDWTAAGLTPAGDVICFLVWFEAELSEGVSISSLPGHAHHCHHWEPLVLPLVSSPEKGKLLSVESGLDDTECHLHIEIREGSRVLAAR